MISLWVIVAAHLTYRLPEMRSVSVFLTDKFPCSGRFVTLSSMIASRRLTSRSYFGI